MIPKILRMLVTRREFINIDKLFLDMYKDILELVTKKTLIHLTTEFSSLQQFLPHPKGCIMKLERTVEETKIILEGTGKIKPRVLERPPNINLDDDQTRGPSRDPPQLLRTAVSSLRSPVRTDFDESYAC